MRVYKDFDLTNYNSYKISSYCDIAYFPEDEEDVISFFEKNKDAILIGSGHNVIFSKEHYNKPVMIFNGNYNSIRFKEGGLVEIETGAMMWDVAKLALKNSLSGIEIFWDIPSSLGGAIVMNAGASGEEIKDVLVKVRYLDLFDNQVKEINRNELSFEYRNSFFQENTNKIILKAWLRLQKGDKLDINKKMETLKERRWAKQPREFPNAGSVFKRPEGFYVGALVEELGLKGFTIGGAKVSEKHGGFIINFNKATGLEILEVIKEIKCRVWAKYKIDLEVEQRII